MPDWISTTLQIVLGVGLLNVWLLRSSRATPYRGGTATSLREEFSAYGLGEGVFYGVGLLKIGAAVALLLGIWRPSLVGPAAMLIVGLMIGALLMHAKVRDPLMRSVPAFTMLVFSAALVVSSQA